MVVEKRTQKRYKLLLNGNGIAIPVESKNLVTQTGDRLVTQTGDALVTQGI